MIVKVVHSLLKIYRIYFKSEYKRRMDITDKCIFDGFSYENALCYEYILLNAHKSSIISQTRYFY